MIFRLKCTARWSKKVVKFSSILGVWQTCLWHNFWSQDDIYFKFGGELHFIIQNQNFKKKFQTWALRTLGWPQKADLGRKTKFSSLDQRIGYITTLKGQFIPKMLQSTSQNGTKSKYSSHNDNLTLEKNREGKIGLKISKNSFFRVFLNKIWITFDKMVLLTSNLEEDCIFMKEIQKIYEDLSLAPRGQLGTCHWPQKADFG